MWELCHETQWSLTQTISEKKYWAMKLPMEIGHQMLRNQLQQSWQTMWDIPQNYSNFFRVFPFTELFISLHHNAYDGWITWHLSWNCLSLPFCLLNHHRGESQHHEVAITICNPWFHRLPSFLLLKNTNKIYHQHHMISIIIMTNPSKRCCRCNYIFKDCAYM